MAALVFAAIASLDGFVNDREGAFDWAAPDEQVHAFVNELERPTETYLYGRRMYAVMRYWAEPDRALDRSAASRDYRALWQAADKVVFSTSLDAVTTPRTRLARSFDADSVRSMKEGRQLSVGGPTLAASAFEAGLVDEVHLFLAPVVVGGGTPALPPGLRRSLSLVAVDRFDSGFVHLHHRVEG
jgi:dihydrofolate reductase